MPKRMLWAAALVAGLAMLTMGGCASAPAASTVPTPFASSSASSTPTPPPAIVGEVNSAKAALGKLAGIASAQLIDHSGMTAPDDNNVLAPPTPGHMDYSYDFQVTMQPDATAEQVGQVPVTISRHIANTSVNLTLTLPATDARVASAIHYESTFDQSISLTTAVSIAEGVLTIASTPGLSGPVTASIPYTMRVDYGSLTVFAPPAALDHVRTVIDGTVFANTTLHGSFANGAKP